MADSSGIVVWTALAANLLVAVVKFVTAAITGSSAMLAEAIHSPVSILIGLLLAAVALVLAKETKGLLIGERADPALSADVQKMIGGFDGVVCANGLLTAQFAPDQVIAIASVAFEDDLCTPQIEPARR